MTTIAVSKTDTGVLFAADEQTSFGSRRVLGTEKVFVNGNVVMGVAGLHRVSDLLRYSFKPPKKPAEMDPNEWVVSKFAPKLLKMLEDNKSLEDYRGMADNHSEIILHAYGVTGYLGCDMSWSGVDNDFWATGSGGDYALGAMAMGSNAADAVEVAIQFDTYSSGDVNVLDVRTTREVVLND